MSDVDLSREGAALEVLLPQSPGRSDEVAERILRSIGGILPRSSTIRKRSPDAVQPTRELKLNLVVTARVRGE
jgi:hypothetical protein